MIALSFYSRLSVCSTSLENLTILPMENLAYLYFLVAFYAFQILQYCCRIIILRLSFLSARG